MADEAGIQANLDEEEKPGKYPRGAALILSLEIFRCYASGAGRSFTMMFVDVGKYTQDQAVKYFHTVLTVSVAFPIIAAIIADTWTGKYLVLLVGSTLASVGFSFITAACVPQFNLPVRPFIWLGIILRSVGWGSISPTMEPIAAEQFELPRQKKYLTQYFSWSHVIANIFIFIGIFITPRLRSEIHCFGQNSCYSLAFLIPSIMLFLLLVALIIFKKILKLYKPTKSNVIVSVITCICNAIITKFKSKKEDGAERRDHWLYYSKEKYGDVFVEEVRGVLSVMILLLPTIYIWCVYFQYESRWVFQATRLDMRIRGMIFKPEDIININSLTCIIFVPLTQWFIYPWMAKVGLRRPLTLAVLGSFIIVISYFMAGALELAIESRFPPPLVKGKGQVRLYNGMNCSYTFSGMPGGKNLELQGFGYYEDTDIGVTDTASFDISCLPGADCQNTSKSAVNFKLDVKEEKSMAYFFQGNNAPYFYEDVVETTANGYPNFRILADASLKDTTIVIKDWRNVIVDAHLDNRDLWELNPGIFDVHVGGNKTKPDFEFLMGAYYMFLFSRNNGEDIKITTHIIREPNHYSVILQIPQVIVIAIGEIMFMLKFREFVFGESPQSLKSFMWAYNLLMNAFGNMISVAIAETTMRMSTSFFLQASILTGVLIIQSIMVMKYKYINPIWQ